ncbi:MAG TPA: hypothetical protein VHX88_05840 [Solirubrobacteraceae bacterium]|nr:hypothetical protein [Solirubrobacteraceae bacterium]
MQQIRLLAAICAAALAVILAAPALAGATTIPADSLISSINVGSDLSCQVQLSGEATPSFASGDCGTWLSLDNAGLPAEDLFGPSGGPTTTYDWTPVSQTLTGTGTATDPYTLTTDVQGNDPVYEGLGSSLVVEVSEVDTYVTGADSYGTTVTITNQSIGESEVRPRTGVRPHQLLFTGVLYHSGACELDGSTASYGVVTAQTLDADPGPECALTSGNDPPQATMAFTPDPGTTGATYLESSYSSVSAAMTDTNSTFNDTVLPGSSSGAGIGIAIPFSLPATDGASATVSFTSSFTPAPPVSSTTVSTGTCAATGELPVSVTAPAGPQAVLYTVDGGAPQSTLVSLSTPTAGTADIPVPAGQHTITFWAQDQFGDQEPTGHTVTVVDGMPTVTVTDNQGVSTYVVGANASATVTASGAGLTTDPSTSDLPLSTSSTGPVTITETATNACGSTSGSLSYTVIPDPTSSTTATNGSCAGTGELLVQIPTADQPFAALYTVDGGTQQSAAANSGGEALIPVPAGEHTITFWAEDQIDVQETSQHTVTLVNGMPTVSIIDNQGVGTYVVGAPASVAVAAAGGSLTSDPSNPDVPLPTTTAGSFTLAETASNVCGDASGSLTYAVIPLPSSSTTVTSNSCNGSDELSVQVPLAAEPEAVLYTVDGGAPQSVRTSSSGTAQIPYPAGPHTISFWAQDQIGVQESTHHTVTVVNERTPTVSITAVQGVSFYVLGASAAAAVTATGGDLASDPSTPDLPLSTATAGTFTITRAATNACGTGTGTLTYTVLPGPVYAQTFNIAPESGEVYVEIPAGAGATDRAIATVPRGVFIPLRSAAEIPTGSIVDSTRGVARLFTAVPRGPVQTGDFTGLFQARQEVSLGALTQIDVINSGGPTACTASASDRRATPHHKPSTHTKLSHRVIGRLTSAVRGAFITQGQYSLTTVRGTSWTVTNQCNGTRTTVQQGSVVVESLRNHRKTIVKAAHSKFVAAPAGATAPRPGVLPRLPAFDSTPLPALGATSPSPSPVGSFTPLADGKTLISRFGVESAPAGTTISLSCSSAIYGVCPFGHDEVSLPAGGNYNLSGAFGDVPLAAGTQITLAIESPPNLVRTSVYTLRSGKAPLLSTTCSAGGAPTAC